MPFAGHKPVVCKKQDWHERLAKLPAKLPGPWHSTEESREHPATYRRSQHAVQHARRPTWLHSVSTLVGADLPVTRRPCQARWAQGVCWLAPLCSALGGGMIAAA